MMSAGLISAKDKKPTYLSVAISGAYHQDPSFFGKLYGSTCVMIMNFVHGTVLKWTMSMTTPEKLFRH